MLANVSKKMTSYFIRKEVIEVEDREMYDFCFEIMLSTIINLLGIIIIGIVSRRYVEAVCFSIAFMMLRGSAGGYHANSHIACFTTLMIAFGLCIVGLTYIPFDMLVLVSSISATLGIMVVIAIAPIDNKNKKLTKEEKSIQRRKAIINVILLATATIIMSLFKITKPFAFTIGYTIGTVGISMIFGQLKNKIDIKRENETPIVVE